MPADIDVTPHSAAVDDVLTAPGSELHIIVYSAEPGTDDASRLNLLSENRVGAT